jgi:hypothetical protein
LARCENSPEKGAEINIRVVAANQGGETDGDEEMIIFSDGADLRAIEDRKCMKLMKMAAARNLGMEAMMWA